jgi:hypothetical protein
MVEQAIMRKDGDKQATQVAAVATTSCDAAAIAARGLQRAQGVIGREGNRIFFFFEKS